MLSHQQHVENLQARPNKTVIELNVILLANKCITANWDSSKDYGGIKEVEELAYYLRRIDYPYIADSLKTNRNGANELKSYYTNEQELGQDNNFYKMLFAQ